MREQYTYEISNRRGDGQWNLVILDDGTFTRDPRSIARALLERWIIDNHDKLVGGQRILIYGSSAEGPDLPAAVRVRVYRGGMKARDKRPAATAYLGSVVRNQPKTDAENAELSEYAPPVPIRIYLADGDAQSVVEPAVRKVADLVGIGMIEAREPLAGSWFGEFIGRLTKPKSDTDEILAKLARAGELQLIHRPQAEVDAAQGHVVAELISSLAHTHGAVIQIGSVLLVKFDETILVRNLTQAELIHWEQNPGLFKDPSAAFTELQRADLHGNDIALQAGASSRQPCSCGSGRPLDRCHPPRTSV